MKIQVQISWVGQSTTSIPQLLFLKLKRTPKLWDIHAKNVWCCGEGYFGQKKIAEKVRKSGRHFWAIWGNCGPFWVIFGPLWIILGHSRAILGHFGSYLGHFGPFWVILGHFWAICSRDSRETLKYGTFGRKKLGWLMVVFVEKLHIYIFSSLWIWCETKGSQNPFRFLFNQTTIWEPRGLTDDQEIIIRWLSVLENHVVWVVDLIPASAAAAAMVVELSEEQQRKP